MKNTKKNKTSKLAVRLEPKEKQKLNYFATRLGMSASALVRNQVKKLLQDLGEAVADQKYVSLAKIQQLHGPTYSQEELEDIFEIQ